MELVCACECVCETDMALIQGHIAFELFLAWLLGACTW